MNGTTPPNPPNTQPISPPIKSINISKISEEITRDKVLRLKARLDSDSEKPIFYVSALDVSKSAGPISQEDAIARARSLWQADGKWNVSCLEYKEAHPVGIKLPEDLNAIMIPEDLEEAIRWIESIARNKNDNKKAILRYTGDELVKIVNLFSASGYIIEQKSQEEDMLRLGEIEDLHQMLMESANDASVIAFRTTEGFDRRFRDLVFLPALKLFRKSFSKDGITKKIIVTDVDLFMAYNFLETSNVKVGTVFSILDELSAKYPYNTYEQREGSYCDLSKTKDKLNLLIEKQDVNCSLFSNIIKVKGTPLRVVFTNKKGTFTLKTVVGKDKTEKIHIDQMPI